MGIFKGNFKKMACKSIALQYNNEMKLCLNYNQKRLESTKMWLQPSLCPKHIYIQYSLNLNK